MKWYCVCANPYKTTTAAKVLREREYEVLSPSRVFVTPKTHRLLEQPLFGNYFFVRFDVEQDDWRNDIWHAPHIKRIMAATPESPTPISDEYIQQLLDRLTADHKLDERQPPTPNLKDRHISFETNGYVWDGLCTDSTEKNVEVLMNVMGGERKVTVDRSLVQVSDAA